MLTKIAAPIVLEAHPRLVAPVVAEYRKLTAPPSCALEHVGEIPRYDPTGTTGAHIERAAGWDHDTRPPATAVDRQFGFGHDRGQSPRLTA